MTLDLHDITLSYPDGDSRLVALDAVNLTVQPGELLALIGPSGSGKSSLLAVAGLLLTPDAGRINVGGLDATALGTSRRSAMRLGEIGFVFQQNNLIASLTAVEQLEIVARLAGRRGPGVRARAEDLLTSVGLADRLDRRPHQLSGGQRQRVAIARALMNSPSVLLVDEPTSALDEQSGRAVVELLRRVTHDREVATVLVTHDVAHLHLVDAVVEMRDGRLRERLAAA